MILPLNFGSRLKADARSADLQIRVSVADAQLKLRATGVEFRILEPHVQL